MFLSKMTFGFLEIGQLNTVQQSRRHFYEVGLSHPGREEVGLNLAYDKSPCERSKLLHALSVGLHARRPE